VVLGQGVLQTYHVKVWSVETSPADISLATEGHMQKLVEAKPDKELAESASVALFGSELVVRLTDARERCLDSVIPVKARDFLDEVRLVGNIVPPGRRNNGAAFFIFGLYLEAKVGKVSSLCLRLDMSTEKPVRPRVTQIKFDRLKWPGVFIQYPWGRFRPSQVLHKAASTIKSVADHLDVRASLETLRSFCDHAESASGRADGDSVKTSALEENVRGGLPHFGLASAHNAGDSDRTLGIGDDQGVVPQGAGLFVDGFYCFVLFRKPDHNAVLDQFVQVKCMQGMPRLHQDIVGDVNNVVDGALARSDKTSAEPARGRPDLDISENPAGIAGT
jgi:hypothetical protein